MAAGRLLSVNCDIRVGLAGTTAGITELRVGRGSPWAAPLLWMLPPLCTRELTRSPGVDHEAVRDNTRSTMIAAWPR